MNFFRALTGNIVKWWRLEIMPVFKINNNAKTQPMQETQSMSAEPVNSTQNIDMSDVAGGDNAEAQDALAVLNRINQEKEDLRRKEIELAKREAEEKARIAAIMNANKVDVNSFIQAGKEAYEEVQQQDSNDDAKKAEELRRAQEIMERLNREAAEDEAKKQAEIDAAKREAEEQFG